MSFAADSARTLGGNEKLLQRIKAAIDVLDIIRSVVRRRRRVALVVFLVNGGVVVRRLFVLARHHRELRRGAWPACVPRLVLLLRITRHAARYVGAIMLLARPGQGVALLMACAQPLV